MSPDKRLSGWLALAATIALVPAAILRGWVLSILWQWFIVPLGVPLLGVVHAIGISILVSMLTHEGAGTQGNKYDDDPKIKMIVAIFLSFAYPLLSLGYAALIRWVAS